MGNIVTKMLPPGIASQGLPYLVLSARLMPIRVPMRLGKCHLVVRFTNNVVVGPFLYPTQQELLENAATRVLASSACLVE
jgi:hypothetical protein